MLTIELFNNALPKPEYGYKLDRVEYNTKDIVNQVRWVDKRVRPYTAKLSKYIEPSYEGFKELYSFLMENVNYKKDPRDNQWVRNPSRLWFDGEGDCKSFTVFITSVCQNLGLKYTIRFASYDRFDRRPTHVYPIVQLPNGRRIKVDPVWGLDGGKFNTEKTWRYKQDFNMKPKKGLAYLYGTVDNEAQTKQLLAVIEEINKNIPDTYLVNDVTKMSKGGLQRFLMSEQLRIASNYVNGQAAKQDYVSARLLVMGKHQGRSINGIGNQALKRDISKFLAKTATKKMQAPAFKAPKVKVKVPEQMVGQVSGWLDDMWEGVKNVADNVWDGIKDAGEAVSKFFKQAWAKLMNWIFKEGLVKGGPHYTFQFLKNADKSKLSNAVKKRFSAQKKSIDFMLSLGMDKEAIKAAIRNGIVAQYGASPSVMIEKARNYKGGVGNTESSGSDSSGSDEEKSWFVKALDIGGMVGFIVQVIQRIAALFKKDEVDVNTEDFSDLTLLENTMPGAEASSGGSGLAIPLLLGGGLLLTT